MLYSIDFGKYVTSVPHKKDFEKWMKNLSADNCRKIEEELNSKIDQNDINTAGWLPSHDWTGTVYEPIYRACGKNVSQSGSDEVYQSSLMLFRHRCGIKTRYLI